MSLSNIAVEVPRPVKRQRRSSSRLDSRASTSTSGSRDTPATSRSPTPTTPSRLDRFLTWCESQDIHIEPCLDLRFTGDALSWSIAVHARTAIDNDTVVATIPKTAVLSRKTSALSSVLKGKWLSESHETVGLELALCLLYERCLGTKSQFEPFIGILPRLSVPLPFLRDESPDSPWRWLAGTEADRIDRRAALSYHRSFSSHWPYDHDYGMCKQKTLDYFHNVGIPVLARSKLFDRTQKQHLDGLEGAFLTAYTHVSSRDFIVDTYHGVGLVPVADLWNHAEVHTVQFESDQDVCEVCGVALLTGHDEEACRLGMPADADETEEREEEGDETDGNEAELAGDELEETSSRKDSDVEPSTDPAEGVDGDDIEHNDTLDMRTLTSHAPGDEMYNTYGALTNALMLTRYGFCLDTETDVERFTLDLSFADERKAFLEAFINSPSAFKKVGAVSAALKRVLAFVAAKYPKEDEAEEEEEENQEDIDPEARQESVAIDALYRLDELIPSPPPDWLATAFCPLFRHNPALNEELDEDLVDRDHVHPLFASSTGQISRPLLLLTLLIHSAHASAEGKVSPKPTDWKLRSKLMQQALQTLHAFWTARLARLDITQRVEDALQRLSEPAVEYIEKACIQHAYQEHVAVKGAVALLEDLIS
ncbi:hypothetical protein PSEUBRA_000074 [Kalmanozyma brasiliensis GHG001]|uniref:SET domain-containing protein n=1 Tax=Kalmanozyma brasiliensis (strain GHG001) TaxID=1365824 RepID=V5F2N6_KALBG|nr:uncharacterized protein PSEUBRA_000074 [Kalmanozyma brasiliensis GHG001]EST09699.1 hypothetical protein PSEUBRA_000074 [Kalmanozyma brasiliensis GHG001]